MSAANFIKQNGTPVSVENQDHVFRQGDQNEALYYVVSGLLKAYYVSAEGKENIKSFIRPGSTIGSLSAAHSGLPCTFNLVALEHTQLIRIPFGKLLQAAHDSHAIAREVIDTLLGHSMKKEQREYEFLMLPAEDRYLNFRAREPELLNRLTQNDVARYLGITPVALSRIKKRLEG